MRHEKEIFKNTQFHNFNEIIPPSPPPAATPTSEKEKKFLQEENFLLKNIVNKLKKPRCPNESESFLMEQPKLLMSDSDLVSCGVAGAGLVVGGTTTITSSSVLRRRVHFFKKIAQKQQQHYEQPTDYISRTHHHQHLGSSSIGSYGPGIGCKSMQNQIIGSFYCIDDCGGDIMKRKIKQQPYFNVSVPTTCRLSREMSKNGVCECGARCR